ncbi:glycosyltransferase [Psychroserpens sp. BH13MA-6]
MTKDLISIVIPFKDTAVYIAECLDSIVNQSYEHWELLIVDDHSSDNSFDIVTSYALKDQRIKLFKNQGYGIINALQLAFSKSKGDYITRMDSDDLMHPDRLHEMYRDLQFHGKQHIALGLVKYFNAEGIGDGYAKYEAWLNALTLTGKNYSEIYKECVIPSPCWMMHRSDFVLCKGFQPNRYPEDYDLAFRFYKYGMTCIPANKVLHYWRDHSTRASRTHEHYAENYFLELKVDYFLELNDDPQRPLVVWGAGKKGKKVVQLLKEKNRKVFWVCDNVKKIGKHIYDELLHDYNYLASLEAPQCIVTVANPQSQQEIKSYLESQDMNAMVDYFFFC